MSISEQQIKAFDQRFAELVRSGDLELPPFPSTAAKLLRAQENEASSLRDLSRIVASDEVLAAAVLRRANSASFAGPQVTTLDAAATRIGSSSIFELALSLGAGAVAGQKGLMLRLRTRVWRQSLLSAELCRILAEKRGLDINEAFLCGLLHDFGKVVGIACLERIAKDYGSELRLAEEKCLQIIEHYHVELGMALAVQWQLPEAVEWVIRQHHDFEERQSVLPTTEVTIVADHVVERMEETPRSDEIELGDIPFIDDDVALVRQSLPDLAEIFQELDPEGFERAGRRPPKSALEEPTTTLTSACPFRGHARVANKEFRCEHIAEDGFSISSRATLKEESVLAVSIENEHGPLEFFARVSRCTIGKRGFQVELKPLALAPIAAETWSVLMQSCRAASAA